MKVYLHSLTRGVGLGWYMAGPGLERVWNGMERGLERTGPLQHSHAARLCQNIGPRVPQQAILRLPAGSQPNASLESLPSHSTAVPQRAATVSSAGANLPMLQAQSGQPNHGLARSKRIRACMLSYMYVRSCTCVQM